MESIMRACNVVCESMWVWVSMCVLVHLCVRVRVCECV